MVDATGLAAAVGMGVGVRVGVGTGVGVGVLIAHAGVGVGAVATRPAVSVRGRFVTAAVQMLISTSAPTIEPATIQKRGD